MGVSDTRTSPSGHGRFGARPSASGRCSWRLGTDVRAVLLQLTGRALIFRYCAQRYQAQARTDT